MAKNIKHSSIPLLLGALLVCILILAAWQPSLTGRVTATPYCFDRDGDSPVTFSETVTSVNGEIVELFDTCNNEGLTEYTCNGDQLTEKTYKCTCIRGRCVDQPT